MRAIRPILFISLALTLAAPALSGAPVVQVAAKVGDQVITNVDLDEAVKAVLQGMTEQERNSPEGRKKLATARANVLDRMIEMRLVVLAAKDGPEGYKAAVDAGKAGTNPFLPDSSEIETEMEKMFDQTRQSFPDQEAFEAALLKEHVSVPEFRNRLREQVRDQMTYARMIKMKEREMQPSLRVSDEEAKAYYDEHADNFAQGDQVKLRHILYPAADEAKARAALAGLRKAKDVKAAFIAQARKDSADTPTKDQGGLLGWIEKGQSWPELEKAAFASPDDALAGPVKSDAGWHILYVEGHQSGKARNFDEVKGNARNMVYQQKLKDRETEWVQELKTKYYVEQHEEASKP